MLYDEENGKKESVTAGVTDALLQVPSTPSESKCRHASIELSGNITIKTVKQVRPSAIHLPDSAANPAPSHSQPPPNLTSHA